MESAVPIIAQEASRSSVYRCLAEAFRLPGADLASTLVELREHLGLLGSTVHPAAKDLCQAFARTGDRLSLERDFTALFVGPFLAPAPPYGSVYLEKNRRLMGESTVSVREHYRAAGLDTCEDFKEPPDHIAAELEFMHVLICQEIDAIRGENPEALSDSLNRQKTFLMHHLGAWTPAFFRQVAEYSRTEVYRRLAETAGCFLAEEIDLFRSLSLPWAAPGTQRGL